MPVIDEEMCRYAPTTPEIGRELREGNSLHRIYQSRFKTSDTYKKLVHSQIRLLKLHRELSRSRIIAKRADQTIDYWQRLITDPEATWNTQWMLKDNAYRKH